MNESASAQVGRPACPQAQDATSILWRFSEAIDKRMAAAAARLFASDGVFRRAEEVVRGRTNIESLYLSRMADPRRTTRHQWSNVRCQPLGQLEARVEALLTTYAFEPQISETHLQVRIGNVSCRCIPDPEEGWVFAEHVYERAFVAYLPLSPTQAQTPGAPA